MKDLINLNFISDKIEDVSPRYRNMNKDMRDIPVWFKLTSAVTAGSIVAAACEAKGVRPTTPTEQGTDSNTSEVTRSPENDAYKTEFFWKSDRVAETAQNVGVPVENVSGYQIVIDGAATADGKLKIDFNNFLDEETNTVRSVYYSPLYLKNLNETFLTTKTVDGQEIAQKQYYTSSGEVKTILEYPANSSARLVAGETITATVFPDDIQAAMIPSYDGNGIKVIVSPNPEWQQINNPNIYDQSFDFKVVEVNNPVATAAPTEAPVEIKDFPVCKIENFRDCVITVEELFDGTYLRWLQTQSKPFDPTKVKDVPFDVMTIPDANPMIVYKMDTAPNFSDPDSRPFRRDVTSGIVWVDVDGVNKYPCVVKPLELFDRNNPGVEGNKWVITVESYYGSTNPLTGEYENIPDVDMWMDQNNKVWKNDMGITPIRMTSLTSMTNTTDPLTLRTFGSFQDLQGRFQRFISGDIGALSEIGIVLNTPSTKMSDGLLK